MRRDITALEISPGQGELAVGTAVQLNLLSVTSGGGTGLIPATMATWSSSDPAVAEVSRQGRLTLRKPGTVNITATYAGATAHTAFTVVA